MRAAIVSAAALPLGFLVFGLEAVPLSPPRAFDPLAFFSSGFETVSSFPFRDLLFEDEHGDGTSWGTDVLDCRTPPGLSASSNTPGVSLLYSGDLSRVAVDSGASKNS